MSAPANSQAPNPASATTPAPSAVPAARAVGASAVGATSEVGATRAAPVPAALDDERLTVMGLFAETFSAIATQGATQLARHGLSPVEFEVLIRLARTPMSLLRMTDLATQTSLTASGVTRVVDRLADRGLVARQACATDRRTTYVVLSEPGLALLGAALPGHLEVIEQWLVGPLREAGDLADFTAMLRRLRDRVVPGATAGSGGPDRLPPGVGDPVGS